MLNEVETIPPLLVSIVQTKLDPDVLIAAAVHVLRSLHAHPHDSMKCSSEISDMSVRNVPTFVPPANRFAGRLPWTVTSVKEALQLSGSRAAREYTSTSRPVETVGPPSVISTHTYWF